MIFDALVEYPKISNYNKTTPKMYKKDKKGQNNQKNYKKHKKWQKEVSKSKITRKFWKNYSKSFDKNSSVKYNEGKNFR